MGITIRSLYFFAVLHVLVFTEALCKIDGERNKRDGLTEEEIGVQSLINSGSGYSAGKNTPVWLASGPDFDNNVIYTRQETGIVQKAIDYFKSSNFNGLVSKSRRSVDTNTSDINDDWDMDAEMFSTASTGNFNERPVDKRDASYGTTTEVYHPSVLVVMDYSTPWPSDKQEQEKFILNKILYALAFYNGMDLQFRYLKNPYVRLRIAGIVIRRDASAITYIRKNEFMGGLDMHKAYLAMTKYWRGLTWTSTDFPNGSYDIVATMTDSQPDSTWKTILGVSTPTMPCRMSTGINIAGLLFIDDHGFNGLQNAVHEMSHILGALKHDGDNGCDDVGYTVMSRTATWVGRQWSSCSLKDISSFLKRYSGGLCLKNAKEYHPPGERVETILPGHIMDAKKQCQHRGWSDGLIKWEWSSCIELFCANHASVFWRRSGAPVDGTTCGTNKMCLDAKCVTKSIWRG